MASFSDILKKLFGSKEERDMKQIKPLLDKVLLEYERVDKLSNDELRAESEKIRKVVLDTIAEDEKKKSELKERLESLEISAQEKEKVANQIDKLTAEINEKIEEVLNKVLPIAFLS